MKKIFLVIASLIVFMGCMERVDFNPEIALPDESSESYTAPLEIAFGTAQTKSFDENLKWSWEETDKIYGYQVSGSKSVNTLTFVEDNRFGTPEFAYSTNDPATFHFVYAEGVTLDQTVGGDRGIRQSSRQSGKWTPVLVGTAVNKSISEVMNDEVDIDMEHLSAALEVRLWKGGVDKNNLSDAYKKNIVYAELMSDTENFLLDVVPTYNPNGTITYGQRERDPGEETGGYIRTEDVNSPVVVFNIAPHAENYIAGALRLAIVDENGDRYVLDVPALNFVAGQRTILNVEWKKPTSANLPAGKTFKNRVDAFMAAKGGITKIKFITNSATTSADVLVESSIYLVKNGETLEIHTGASQFMANSDCNRMFNSFNQIVSIDFGDNFNTSNVTDMYRMFYYCSSLASLDLSNFNTANVTDMSYMFECCYKLASLDVSNFNTGNVTDMYRMFYYCYSLASLDLSSFNTAKVTNMSYMFFNCRSLASLDLSNFNTGNVTDMEYVFSYCRSLVSLDVSNFNTGNVTDMSCMFTFCESLASLDLSSFNTAKVTIMNDMFSNCSSLTSLDVSNFNTGNVTNMGGMFSSCERLASLDVSNFNTGKVTKMIHMFSNCERLASLDLSSFNTVNVTEMNCMFSNCSSLASLDVSNFNTAKVTNMSYMFSECSSLASLDLSSFSFMSNPSISYMFFRAGDATNKRTPIYVTAEGKSYIETAGSSAIDGRYATLTIKNSSI